MRDLHVYGSTLKQLFRIAPETFRVFTGCLGAVDSERRDIVDEELYRVSGDGIWKIE